MSDQKYRQRGYRDSDRDEPREQRSGGPRPGPRREGPRGRGLGKPTATVFRCAVCGHQQSPGIAIESVCERCGADLHTCTHCASFDISAPNECRRNASLVPLRGNVTQAVTSKAKSNRCELFEAKAAQETARQTDSPTSARDAFDALFKI